MKKLVTLLPVLAGACWGSSGIFVRILTGAGLNNPSIVFARLSLTVSFMAIWMLITDRSLFKVSRRDVPLLMVSGFFGYFIMNLTYNYSINVLSLSLASVLLCTAPVFVIIFGSILFKEKITPVKILCMFGVIAGCVCLSGIVESGALQWSLLGIAMGIGSSIGNAVCTLGCNEASGVRGLHPVTILFYNCLFAFIPMIFLGDIGSVVDYIASAPAVSLSVLIANALISSLLPNLLFNISFKYMESGVVSILASGAEPAAALIFGILIYSEIPTVYGIIGMILVIGSLSVLSGVKSSAEKKPQNI